MYEIVNKQVKFLTSQHIGTWKSAYTKGYALNWALTEGWKIGVLKANKTLNIKNNEMIIIQEEIEALKA